MANQLQSVLFDTKFYTPETSLLWLTAHGLRSIRPLHSTKKFIHARIRNPSQFQTMRIKRPNDKIEFIVGFNSI